MADTPSPSKSKLRNRRPAEAAQPDTSSMVAAPTPVAVPPPTWLDRPWERPYPKLFGVLQTSEDMQVVLFFVTLVCAIVLWVFTMVVFDQRHPSIHTPCGDALRQTPFDVARALCDCEVVNWTKQGTVEMGVWSPFLAFALVALVLWVLCAPVFAYVVFYFYWKYWALLILQCVLYIVVVLAAVVAFYYLLFYGIPNLVVRPLLWLTGIAPVGGHC